MRRPGIRAAGKTSCCQPGAFRDRHLHLNARFSFASRGLGNHYSASNKFEPLDRAQAPRLGSNPDSFLMWGKVHDTPRLLPFHGEPNEGPIADKGPASAHRLDPALVVERFPPAELGVGADLAERNQVRVLATASDKGNAHAAI